MALSLQWPFFRHSGAKNVSPRRYKLLSQMSSRKPGLRQQELSMKLGYARISTSDQDASMQIEALIPVGVDPKRIFTDELSGPGKRRSDPV